jgi:hypothetical protein
MKRVFTSCEECRGSGKYRGVFLEQVAALRESANDLSQWSWYYKPLHAKYAGPKESIDQFRASQVIIAARLDEADQLEQCIDKYVEDYIGKCQGPITISIGSLALVTLCGRSQSDIRLDEVTAASFQALEQK